MRASVNSPTQTINFVSGLDTGTVDVVWTSPTQIRFNIASGTPAFFVLNTVCFYNNISINNYTNKIHNHSGDIFNHSNTNSNYANSNFTLNENSTFVSEGNTILNNVTVVGSILVAQKVQVSNIT